MGVQQEFASWVAPKLASGVADVPCIGGKAPRSSALEVEPGQAKLVVFLRYDKMDTYAMPSTVKALTLSQTLWLPLRREDIPQSSGNRSNKQGHFFRRRVSQFSGGNRRVARVVATSRQ